MKKAKRRVLRGRDKVIKTEKHKRRPGSGVIAPPPVRSGWNNDVEIERF